MCIARHIPFWVHRSHLNTKHRKLFSFHFFLLWLLLERIMKTDGHTRWHRCTKYLWNAMMCTSSSSDTIPDKRNIAHIDQNEISAIRTLWFICVRNTEEALALMLSVQKWNWRLHSSLGRYVVNWFDSLMNLVVNLDDNKFFLLFARDTEPKIKDRNVFAALQIDEPSDKLRNNKRIKS